MRCRHRSWSPTQIVVPVIPPAGTVDPFGRGNGFDLDLAKVMCDVSVISSLISPLQDVEVPPCSIAAEYAAPATPALETVGVAQGIRSRRSRDLRGYRGSCRYQRLFWKERGGYLRSLEEPLLPQVPTPAVTTAIAPVVAEPMLPMVPPTPDDKTTVPDTESARKTEWAQVFVVEIYGGAPLIGNVCGCQ